MRRLISILAVLLVGIAASGQNVVTNLVSSLSDSCAEFDYKYTVRTSVPLTGNGHISLQGDSFKMSGNGLDIRCDGSVLWTVDEESEECYIQDVSDSGSGLAANPALLVSSVGDSFNVTGISDSVFNGRKVKAASLVPSTDDNPLSEAVLYFNGNVLSGASFTLEDGTVTDVVISSFKTAKKKPQSEFSFDAASLPSSYVVTDLR